MCDANDAAKTDEQLFLASFEGEYDDDSPWSAVSELRRRNTDSVFRLAAAYSASEVPIERTRALDVLAQLGAGKPADQRPHFEDCVSIGIAHLADDHSSAVSSAAWALAHLGGERARSALMSVKGSRDPSVRWAVATGLAGRPEPDAIHTLIELMDDEDEEVRNWATFGLGMAYECETNGLGSLDSNEIREAFRKRLEDSSCEVRDEALWGLARRRDRAALRTLLLRLDSEEWLAGDEMAAADILNVDHRTPVDILRAGLTALVGETRRRGSDGGTE